ncbi:MAG: DNA double-strand break repair nuclease NurA [Chloroflexi bacterium]|nr:DNA double-strand break repair nuclease NurA [Chloroflexota bacterium]
MSLEFSTLLTEIETMGATLAKRTGELAERLPEARAALESIGLADDELHEKIRRAGDGWHGAIPAHEPVNSAVGIPPHPERADILGADGSQVYPDRHGSALYYLVNVGSILYPHGAAQAPRCFSSPQVFYHEEELYGDSDGLIPTALIDGKRDTAELAELARLAEETGRAETGGDAVGATVSGRPGRAETGGDAVGATVSGRPGRAETGGDAVGATVSGRPGRAETGRAETPAPTLALVDNGLMLWLALESKGAHQREAGEILRQYIDQLDRVRDAGATIAGFVGRPRNANVLALLHLHSLAADQINPDTLRASRYRGLTDGALFHLLGPGERSALFINASLVNRDFKARGHEMYFFYLNCGREGKPEIARVEVPQWVALDADRLDFVHAALVEQCRVPDGFPYVLARAHELAVVTMEERRALEEMVQGALLRRGLLAEISQKAQTKQWTGVRRRHRL